MSSDWGLSVVKLSLVSVALTLLASAGSQPSYAVPLAFLGVFVPHVPKPFLTSLLFVVLPCTIILDITWCSLYGPYLGSGAPLLALVLTVVNLFMKIPISYMAYELMLETGGNPMVLLDPALALGGAGLGDGSHERISDI